MIKMMKNNVEESIGRIVYPIQVSSVEQLRIECNEAEKNFPRRDMRNMAPPPRPTRQVSEVYAESSEYMSDIECEMFNSESIAALQIKRNTNSTSVCWNCRKSGH